MLYFLPSKLVALVSPEIACFETAYGVVCGRGTCAAIDPLLIILPGARVRFRLLFIPTTTHLLAVLET